MRLFIRMHCLWLKGAQGRGRTTPFELGVWMGFVLKNGHNRYAKSRFKPLKKSQK